MDKQEALKKIEELKEFIKTCDKKGIEILTAYNVWEEEPSMTLRELTTHFDLFEKIDIGDSYSYMYYHYIPKSSQGIFSSVRRIKR